MEKIIETESEEVIDLVHKNQRCRETVSGYFIREDQAKEMLVRCHKAQGLERKIAESERENFSLKVLIVAVTAILLVACIGGVKTEAMTPSLAWAMAMPISLGAVICCLPRAKEGRDE